MARIWTTAQVDLLKSGAFKARLLTTWYLDIGTYSFCDDVEDLTDGSTTWLGASMLASCTDIRSSGGFAAESVTLIMDGTRMSQAGLSDPDAVFRAILTYELHQRRVNFFLGISPLNQQQISMVMPLYAGKINNAKMVDPKMNSPYDTGKPEGATPSNLEIMIDSLAMRYQRVTGRTRSHNDQLEIDSSDLFYQFTQDSLSNSTLYWGKTNPFTGATGAKAGAYRGGGFIGGIINNALSGGLRQL